MMTVLWTILRGSRKYILALGLSAFLIGGCSLLDSPTASTSADPGQDLWNPSAGDEIVSGRDVPILDDNYWEMESGTTINPAMNPRLAGVTPVLAPIDGANGGTVTLGRHHFTVPAGAVDGVVTFTLAYASVTGVGVDCGPSPISFDEPVMLTLSYYGTQYANSIEGLDPSALRIFYAHEDGTLEEVEGCVVDLRALTVTAPVTHFSRYILG